VGLGFAGAAVRNGQVYVLDRLADRQDVLRCIDLNTGRELWTNSYNAPGTLPYPGSRQVPTVDEKLIFTVGPFGNFNAIDRQTHRIVWSHHLVNDFKEPSLDKPEKPKNRADQLARAQVPQWGVVQSPLLYEDLVIVAPQTQEVGLAAYEKTTGKLHWSSRYIGRNWYSHVSPTLMRLCNTPQIIMLAQPSDPEKSPADAPPATISSVDPKTGQILWQTRTPQPHKIVVPEPTQIGNDRLLITGGYGTGCAVVTVKQENGTWNTAVWRSNVAASHIHSPVLYRDHLYIQSFKEHGSVNSGLVCLDLNLNVKWATGPKLQFEFGGFLVADGLIFAMNGRNGELSLLDADPSGFRVLGRAKVLEAEGATAWAPLALSNGKLLVRDQHMLKCLAVGKSQ